MNQQYVFEYGLVFTQSSCLAQELRPPGTALVLAPYEKFSWNIFLHISKSDMQLSSPMQRRIAAGRNQHPAGTDVLFGSICRIYTAALTCQDMADQSRFFAFLIQVLKAEKPLCRKIGVMFIEPHPKGRRGDKPFGCTAESLRYGRNNDFGSGLLRWPSPKAPCRQTRGGSRRR